MNSETFVNEAYDEQVCLGSVFEEKTDCETQLKNTPSGKSSLGESRQC